MGGEGRLIAGRYRLVAPLGRGAMGTVWMAEDEFLDRKVAVKEVMLPPDLSVDERQSRRLRFLREARAAADLNHPGVITMHGVVEDGGKPWIVMELFPGRSLRDELLCSGALPVRRVAQIGLQLAEALQTAHARGIVHRDIKPANIMVDGSRAVLADFGIAAIQGDPTITQSGYVVGTIPYMAPEHLRGQPSAASDMWSLGVTLYEALEGHGQLLGIPPVPPRHAGLLLSVLTGLLEVDTVKRLTARDAAAMFASVAAAAMASPGTSGQYIATAPGLSLGSSPGSLAAPPSPPRGPTQITAALSGSSTITGYGPPGRGTQPAANPVRVRSARARFRLSRRRSALLVMLTGAVAAVVVVVVVAAQTAIPSASPLHIIESPALSTADAAIALSPDGKVLATSDSSGGSYDEASDGAVVVRLWDFVTGRQTGTFNPPGGVTSLAFSADGRLLAAGTGSGRTYVWDLRTRTRIADFTSTYAEPVSAVAFSPDGKLVAAGTRDPLAHADVWNLASEHHVSGFDEGTAMPQDVTALAFSPDGTSLAAGYGDGYTEVWNVSTRHVISFHEQAEVPSSAGNASTFMVTAVSFSPDGNTVATGDDYGYAYYWDQRTDIRSGFIASPAVGVDAMAFVSMAGPMVAMSGGSEGMALWDGRQQAAWLATPDGADIIAAAFSADGSRLAAMTNNGYAYLWDS